MAASLPGHGVDGDGGAVVAIRYSQIKITRSWRVDLDLSLCLESPEAARRLVVSMWAHLLWDSPQTQL